MATPRKISCLLTASQSAFTRRIDPELTHEQISKELKERVVADRLIYKQQKRILSLLFPKAHVSLGPLRQEEKQYIEPFINTINDDF